MSSSLSVTTSCTPSEAWEKAAMQALQESNPNLFGTKSRTSLMITLPPFIERLIKDEPSPLTSRQLEQLKVYNKQINAAKFVQLTVIATIIAGIAQGILSYGIDSSSIGGACMNGFFTILTGLGFLLLAREQASAEQQGIRLKDLFFNELCEEYEKGAREFLAAYVESTPLKDLRYNHDELVLLGYSDHTSTKLTFKTQSIQFTNKAKHLSKHLPVLKAIVQERADFTETQIKKLFKPLSSSVAIIESSLKSEEEIDGLIDIQYKNMRRNKMVDLTEQIRVAKLGRSSPSGSFILDVD